MASQPAFGALPDRNLQPIARPGPCARIENGMSETKTPGDKKLSVSGKTLSLKRGVEQGTVRQSFSHGRSKQVVVEKVKRRSIGISKPIGRCLSCPRAALYLYLSAVRAST